MIFNKIFITYKDILKTKDTLLEDFKNNNVTAEEFIKAFDNNSLNMVIKLGVSSIPIVIDDIFPIGLNTQFITPQEKYVLNIFHLIEKLNNESKEKKQVEIIFDMVQENISDVFIKAIRDINTSEIIIKTL